MALYLQEQDIADQILTDTDTVACVATLTKADDNCVASFSEYDPTSHFMVTAILVSSGWNLNDDVFLSSELFNARNTPVNSKCNIEHNEKKMVGHVVSSKLVDSGLVEISDVDETTECHLMTMAFVHRVWRDPELSEEVAQLISDIEQGLYSVSMECKFGNFDYAIIAPDGRRSAVARNENTAFLTKHLTRYGGSGVYNGYRVGRLLKQIKFIGKGFTKNPANPSSRILTAEKFTAEATYTVANFMETPTMNELEQVKSQLTTVKAEFEAYKKSNEEVASIKTELEKTKADAEASKAELAKVKADLAAATEDSKATKVAFDAAQVEVAKARTEVEAVTKDRDALKAEMDKIEATNRAEARVAALKDVYGDTAAEKAKELADMSDEAFAKIVGLLKEVKPTAEKKPDPKELETLTPVETPIVVASVEENKPNKLHEEIRTLFTPKSKK